MDLDTDTLTNEYLESVANEWGNLHVTDSNDSKPVSLKEIYLMLNALPNKTLSPTEKRDELADTPERRLNVSNGQPSESQVQNLSKNKPFVIPEPLSKILNESKHLVLLGEPGAGKSTTLKFIGLCFAKQNEKWPKQYLGMNEKMIPVFLRLSDFASRLDKSIDVTLKSGLINAVALKIEHSKLAEELIERWIESGRLLVLLDGLDEAKSRRNLIIERIRDFANLPLGRNTRIILTSRLGNYGTLEGNGAQSNLFKEFTLKPLQADEADNYVQRWLRALKKIEWDEAVTNQKSDNLIKHLKTQPALLRLRDNPLFLRLATQNYVSTDKLELVEDRAGVYKAYIEEAWNRAKERGAQNEYKSRTLLGLEVLAWHLQTTVDKSDEISAIEALKKYAPDDFKTDDDLEARNFLAAARIQMGLIALVEGHLTFTHQTFQEYFVALRLKNAWDQGDKKKRDIVWHFIKRRLHLPEWRESILLLGGMFKESDAILFIQQIRKAGSSYEKWAYRDLDLASSILMERNDCRDYKQELLKEAKKDFQRVTDDEKRLSIVRFLSSSSSNGAFLRLEILLKLVSFAKQTEPAFVIKLLKDQKFEQKIIELLSEDSSNLPNDLKDALCSILIKQSDYPNKYFSQNLIDVLLEYRPNLVFEAMKKFGGSIFSIYALGKSKSERAIPILTKTLYYSGYEFYTEASNALINFWDKKAVTEALIRMYKTSRNRDKDGGLFEDFGNDYYYCHGELRCKIVDVLGKIGGEDIKSFLLELALEDNYGDVRRTAYELILKSNTPNNNISTLQKAIKDKDREVRRMAQELIVELIEPKESIPLLLRAATEFGLTEYSSIIYLNYIEKRSSEVIPVLIELLQSGQYPSLTREIVYKLGIIGTADQIPMLWNTLDKFELSFSVWHDETKERERVAIFENFRFTFLRSLARLGDEAALEKIVEYIEDDTYYKNALELLVEIGAKNSIDAIIKHLQENHSYYHQEACVDALGKLGAKKAVPELIKIVDKHPTDVITALGLLGDSSVIPIISKYLVDEYMHGTTAVKALVVIGHRDAVPELKKCLQFEERWVRDAAVTALGELGSLDAVMDLIQVLKWTDSRTVGAARFALVKINQNYPLEVEAALLGVLIRKNRSAKSEETNRRRDLYFERNVIEVLGEIVRVFGDVDEMASIDILIDKLREFELFDHVAEAIGVIISMSPIEYSQEKEIQKKREKQSLIFRRLVGALKKSMRIPWISGGSFYGRTVIIEIETVLDRIDSYDSRYPNPFTEDENHQKGKKALIWVLWRILATFLICLVALVTLVMNEASKTLSSLLPFSQLSPMIVIVILIVSAVVAVLAGWGIDFIRKRP